MTKIISLLFVLFSITSFAQDKILILGDSLTEGHNLNEEDSFPSQLQVLLDKKNGKNKYKVINGGVSGSTTASGLSRLNWFLKAKPKVMVLALGANDGLRGIKLDASQKNLEKIISRAKDKGIKVIIAGMRIPPNYGEDYTKKFQELYIQLAKKFKLKRIPFLLKDVAGKKELNLADGIHPNKKGYKLVAKNVYEVLKEVI